MKKVFLITAVLLSSALTYAQLNFGLKAGYNSSLSLSNIEDVTSGNYTLKSVKDELGNGFHAGAFARIGIEKLYIQPELLYAMSKNDYTITLQDAMNKNVTFDKFVTVSTVEIPVMIGYKILDLKAVNLRAFAGPKFRLDAGSSLDYKNFNAETGSNVTINDIKDDIKKSQIAFELGVGVDVLMLTLDARMSLTNNMAQTKIKDVNIDGISANKFVISLGWKLF